MTKNLNSIFPYFTQKSWDAVTNPNAYISSAVFHFYLQTCLGDKLITSVFLHNTLIKFVSKWPPKTFHFLFFYYSMLCSSFLPLHLRGKRLKAQDVEREVKQQTILRQDVYREMKTKTTDKTHNRMFQGKVNPPSCKRSHWQRNSEKLLEVPETDHIH